jgi:hypothetical protein
MGHELIIQLEPPTQQPAYPDKWTGMDHIQMEYVIC